VKKEEETVLALLAMAALWLIYFEFIYWFIIVVCIDGPWLLVHLASFISCLLVIAITAGNQNKD
jgi:hypothetical protein